jgi:Lar family restriction alleviation protein
MNKELKPCPFCGGKAEAGYLYFRPYIVCRKCHAKIPCYNTYPQAIEAWNTRKPIDKIVEQLEEIRGEHPYKQIGEPDTYSQYNEAWQDCLDRVEDMIVKGGSNE